MIWVQGLLATVLVALYFFVPLWIVLLTAVLLVKGAFRLNPWFGKAALLLVVGYLLFDFLISAGLLEL